MTPLSIAFATIAGGFGLGFVAAVRQRAISGDLVVPALVGAAVCAIAAVVTR